MTVCPLQPHFGVKQQKHLIDEMKPLTLTVSKIVNFFRIGWTVIEKSRPKHDPKWTRLCDFLATGSSWWRHFRWYCKDYRMLYWVKFWGWWLALVVSDIFQQTISWRRTRRRRRTSTIALSENAFTLIITRICRLIYFNLFEFSCLSRFHECFLSKLAVLLSVRVEARDNFLSCSCTVKHNCLYAVHWYKRWLVSNFQLNIVHYRCTVSRQLQLQRIWRHCERRLFKARFVRIPINIA